MAEKYIMLHDIRSEHKDRMYNLRKYYPFFALCENAFVQYKEGRYADLDMGYILMAVLRFFINENNFNERRVTFAEYMDFTKEFIKREFLEDESDEEIDEVCEYIFDKIKNDGKAFNFSYYDPEEKKKKAARIKLIDSEIGGDNVYYSLTSEAIEFYLDTKEIKDESNISVQQVLLEKMIRSENFAGGIDVVKRINNEVSKLALRKNEVLDLLAYDVFAGAEAAKEYMDVVARWFDEENRLFEKNRKLIDKAYKKADKTGKTSLRSIHELDTELKKTIIHHGELIKETIELQNVSDEMIKGAKLRKLRPRFDFRNTLKTMTDNDSPSDMRMVIMPFLSLKRNKSFAAENVDRLLQAKNADGDVVEKVTKRKVDEDFIFEDEIEEKRISGNFANLFTELLNQLEKHGKVTLRELIGIYEIKFGEDIVKNGDMYSFLVHLAEKDSYDIKKMYDKQDTFLEGIVTDKMSLVDKDRFAGMKFKVLYDTSNVIRFGSENDEDYTITDMTFCDLDHVQND